MESRSLFGRYRVAVGLAVAIALLASLGGSWGTASGQTIPNLPPPVAQAEPTAVTQVEAAQPVPKQLPASGEPASSSEIPATLAIASLAVLGTGFTMVRLSSRRR